MEADDENGDDVPSALMQHRFARIGEREVERKQTVVGFSISKSHRFRCDVHFNYCSNENPMLDGSTGLGAIWREQIED